MLEFNLAKSYSDKTGSSGVSVGRGVHLFKSSRLQTGGEPVKTTLIREILESNFENVQGFSKCPQLHRVRLFVYTHRHPYHRKP